MVILYEVDVEAGGCIKLLAVETFEEKTALVAEYLGFDDFNVGDFGVDDFHYWNFGESSSAWDKIVIPGLTRDPCS